MFKRDLVASSVVVAALAFTFGCDKKEPPATTTPQESQAAQKTPTTQPKVETPTPTEPAKATTIAAVITLKDVGLSTPESAIYDDVNDDYLVTNIQGSPTGVDGNGFISRISPEGKVATLKWIEGGKNKVTLNAPKGMAFTATSLYVADIDTVRIFDRKTGAPSGDVKIPGATFVNDITATTDGRIIVSDSGLKVTAKGFEPTGTDAIYAIDANKKVSAISKTKDLGNPNGVLAIADKIWVVNGGGELFALDAKGAKTEVTKLPKATLDGIVPIAGGEILVSSWDASSIYRGKAGGEWKAAIESTKSPADIGYDAKRGRVLVPLFTENEFRAYELR